MRKHGLYHPAVPSSFPLYHITSLVLPDQKVFTETEVAVSATIFRISFHLRTFTWLFWGLNLGTFSMSDDPAPLSSMEISAGGGGGGGA